MKPGLPINVHFHSGLILPLLPFFLLGAAVVTGSKKTLVAEANRRDLTEKLAALEAAPKGLPYGPFEVTRTPDILLKDLRRRKDLLVTVTAPQTGGPFPLIVFSHGAGGDSTQNEPLLRWWASNGYVVLSPTHSDSLRWQQRRSALCETDSVDIGEGHLGVQSVVRLATRDPQCGVQRARDISFVLDSLDALQEQIPSLAGKIDPARVGVAGHSLGASTAQIVGGAALFVPGQSGPLSFRDRRTKAVLQLSGQGTGQQGLTRASWKTFDLPMMTVTGSEDRNPQGFGPDWKRESFDFSPATDNKYLVFIQGAHPGSFGGRFASRRQNKRFASLIGEPEQSKAPLSDQRAIFCYVEQKTLAFWNMTLKNSDAAKQCLNRSVAAPARQSSVVANIDRK